MATIRLSREAVKSMTEEALEDLAELRTEDEFLVQLLRSLVYREK